MNIRFDGNMTVLRLIKTVCCARMGLLSILLVVSVPCFISKQMFYFYPGYVGQQSPVVLPYSMPLQNNINTFTSQSMGNRSTTLLLL